MIVSPEDSYTRHDGQISWLSRAIRLWLTDTGEIGDMVLLSKNITERKLAEAAMRKTEIRFRQAVEHLDEGLVIYDTTGKLLSINPQARAVLQIPVEKGTITQLKNIAPYLEIRTHCPPRDPCCDAASLPHALPQQNITPP